MVNVNCIFQKLINKFTLVSCSLITQKLFNCSSLKQANAVSVMSQPAINMSDATNLIDVSVIVGRFAKQAVGLVLSIFFVRISERFNVTIIINFSQPID